ncbi:MAG: nucleoside-diphosphate kinase [Holosporaceae bacterium]|jgi:nucleoside-diphosphate kinase|nr:nucleoside-diphosphate kinase [Holosporaceae bacterium]
MEKTLSIIKPDAVSKNLTGVINAKFEQAKLRIVAQKRLQLTTTQAEEFYEVHRERAFYSSLCEHMSSGPIVAQVLCGENAIAKNRDLMGATNPANADVGTLRREYGESIERNVVHGSDSPENAALEIGFFFSKLEIIE